MSKAQRTPRKSMAEIRAEERAAGFEACLAIVRREWRKSARFVPMDRMTAAERARWDILEKCETHAGLYDDDHKRHMMPRVYPDTTWKRLRVRVRLKSPHPHAGRVGFICAAKAFLDEHGRHRVWFTDNAPGKADNAAARPEHIQRLEK